MRGGAGGDSDIMFAAKAVADVNCMAGIFPSYMKIGKGPLGSLDTNLLNMNSLDARSYY